MSTATETAPFDHPIAPTTLEGTGLPELLLNDLVIKALDTAVGLSGAEIAKRLGVAFSVIESILEFLKQQRQIEIAGGSMLGGASYRYRLTAAGHAVVQTSLDRNQYAGIAPVPLAQYRRYMTEFSRLKAEPISPEEVRDAFKDLVISEQVLDELGPAINARHSIFIYGPPGNGKSQMAQRIRHLMTGTMAIPHALEVNGSIIRFYDPSVHEQVDLPESDPYGNKYDHRWVRCRRPMIAVGGELTLESLALVFNPRSGTYRAPVQALANGGILLVDDFGRQQCPPRDLLNWWMIPLESRVEYMSLQTGEKIEMPFLALLIFSTNIRPSELVDEAFLRRIQYKIYAEGPTPEDFVEIFKRCCDERQIPFDRKLVDDLLQHFYRHRNIPLRGCHPRDLINQALALASYRGQPRQLTPELLESACASYFISEELETQGPS